MMRILLVEDDRLIARDLIAHLERAGYVVDHARDGEDGWYRGESEDFAAAILDLGLPSMDGMTILKRWRKDGRRFPVLILTARGNWEERVEGIDAGADDYLAKPFQIAEVLARLRAILRRFSNRRAEVKLCPVYPLAKKAVFVRSRPKPVIGGRSDGAASRRHVEDRR